MELATELKELKVSGVCLHECVRDLVMTSLF